MGPARRLGFVLLALAALALVRTLGDEGEPGPGSGRRLVIVSPHWEGIRFELGRAFTAAMRERGEEVEVVWLNPGGTSACLRFVRSRFRELPRGIGADLFFGGGVEPFLALAADGLLDPVELPEAVRAALPAAVAGVPVYDARAGWYGASLTTFGIIYNRPLLARLGIDEPLSFADLARPEARTWVGLADPRMSGTVHMTYELILQARGWDEGFRLIARIAGNSRRIYHHASEVPLEVGAGDIALGTAIDSYAWAQVEALGHDSIGFVAPAGESILNPDAIAVLKGAPERELALEFLAFTLGEAGQALWMLPRGARGGPERYVLGRMPVRPDVWHARRTEATVDIDPFAERRLLDYDPAAGSARWDLVNGVIGAVLVDLHRELTRAWAEVVAQGSPPVAVEILTRPPVAAADLAAATAELADPARRGRLLARWSRDARARYAEAVRLAPLLARGGKS